MTIHNLTRLVILSEGQYILLAKARNTEKEYFFLPGGHIEVTETIEQASIRELREEIGVSADKIKRHQTFRVHEHCWDNKGAPYHEIAFLSLCEIDGLTHKQAVESQEEHLSFIWHDLECLDNINLLPVEFRLKLPHWIKESVPQHSFFSSDMLYSTKD